MTTKKSLIMISDDEDEHNLENRPVTITKSQSTGKSKFYSFDMDMTSDEDENVMNKTQIRSKGNSTARKRSTSKQYKISQILVSDDEDDYDKTIVVNQPSILPESQTKQKLQKNISNISEILISDDENNDITVVNKSTVPNKSLIKENVKKSIKKTPPSSRRQAKSIGASQIKREPNIKTELQTPKMLTVRKPRVKKEPQVKDEPMITDDEDENKTSLKKQIAAQSNTTRKRKNTKLSNDAGPSTSKECDPKAKKIKTEETVDVGKIKSETIWKDHELLADNMNLTHNVAKNIINLFNDGSTIPFIARYRREATGNMSPEVLREVKSAYEDICHLKQKIKTVVHTLHKSGQITEQLETVVKCSKSIEELEIIYAPYKPEGKRTLAERAKGLGLEQPAMELLLNSNFVDINRLVDTNVKDLKTVADVEKWLIHILAHKIATNTDILSFLREIRKKVHFTVETKKLQRKEGTKLKPPKNAIGEKPVDESKFKLYFEFKTSVQNIKPHQILAINRGEHHKVLSVKLHTPSFLFEKFKDYCCKKWIDRRPFDANRRRILLEGINESYNRLIQPFVVREVRSELKSLAEKASYEVFSKNLKQILLAGPIKGQTILGIDPGYAHGCKIAVISPTGTVLDFGVIYPHSNSKGAKDKASTILRDFLDKYDCALISLGDGTASKETEQWLTLLIRNKYFYPRDVKYTIVSEDGASIYSCSPEAKKEFPDMDTNIISAVSLARRIQDPLAELVKVEPKHLGVGMYQHDLKKKTLEEALDEVVSECVSFVGVDLNTASQCLLRRIAGLTDKRATEIVKYRETNGPFISREQLLQVSGIGPKAFQQCAGFLRVVPTNTSTSDFYKNSKTNKLDQTIIHPESYDVTKRLLKTLKLNLEDIGENRLITKIKSIKTELPDVSEQLDTTLETLDLIVDALEKPLDYDLRSEIPQAAFFSTGLKSIEDLVVGSKVMGRVKNVTHFGCFVDIGVGKDCLIHSSQLGGFDLQIGDKIEGFVCSMDKERQRINVKPTAKV